MTSPLILSTRPAAAADAIEPKIEEGIAWYDVTAWGVEGKGFADTARYFDRLPARAESSVRGAVWSLSRDSAGMVAHFETDASAIHVRYELFKDSLSMPHMPATGVSGLDLYGQDAEGAYRWMKVVRPSKKKISEQLVSGITPGRRKYMLYLPLYNGVETLEVGVPDEAKFTPIHPRKQKPLLFYGTSIMHGACASRPGMSITGIVGRRLDVPVINLGFSGNGLMEKTVGDFLVELDPAVYIIDCLPNMQSDLVAKNTEPLVHQLRKARPETPILLVEDRTYTNAPFFPGMQDRHKTSRAALKAAYDRLIAAGVKRLYYLEGESLLGDDGEGATDGSHPNDLGMMRYADAYEKALRSILNRP